MRLAHLVLAHNNPVQLSRLVTRLNHKDADVYIHLDAHADMAEYAHLSDLPGVYFINNRVKVVWGEYSIIRASLIGLEEILASGKEYSHVNFLSGNDYPLQPAEKIQKFFFANAGTSFMWYDLIFNDWIHGQVRINQYNLGDYNFPGRYLLSKLFSKVLPNRKIPGGLKAYGRSQWMTLSVEAARFTLNYIKKNQQLERFFRMTWAVDEVFFQTILCNSELRSKIVNDNLRLIDLNAAYRPVIYTLADAERLIKSGKFYARKFDMNIDKAIFDYLDNKSLA